MRVMVECYHDTALVRSLGVPLRQLGHEHGKGNVLLALAKWRGNAIGVVDADPGKQNSIPGEMAKYREKCQVLSTSVRNLLKRRLTAESSRWR